MTIKALSYSLIKVLSIWIFANIFLPALISILLLLIKPYKDSAEISSYMISMGLIQLPLYFIISAILWLGANRISLFISKHYDEGSTEIENIGTESNKLIQIGIILIGIYVIIINIPYLINNVITYIQYSEIRGTTLSTRNIGDIVQRVVSLAVAACFIISNRKILSVILKLRTLGIEKTDKN